MSISDHVYLASDLVGREETVGEFLGRSGVVCGNGRGRLSICIPGADHQARGWGRVVQVGNVDIKSNISKHELEELIKSSPPETSILETYPTRFCAYERCAMPSEYFVSNRGQTACRRCGTVQKSVRSHMRRGCLTGDGKVNMSSLDFTPNMTVLDTGLKRNRKGRKSGRDLELDNVTKTRAHQRTLFKRLKLINDITNGHHWSGIDFICNLAANKMRELYRVIHKPLLVKVVGDRPKQWHGDALTAAACLYVANLEFESSRYGVRTPLTLLAIQESASEEVIPIAGRAVRDVTVLRIHNYALRLKKWGLCSATIPSINAKTITMTPGSAPVEHSRLFLQAQCEMVHVHLPTKGPLGLTIKSTESGVLKVEKLQSSSAAYMAGIREGDFLFQLEKTTIPTGQMPDKFVETLLNWREAHKERISMEMILFRRRASTI